MIVGIGEFARRILADGADDPMVGQIPAMWRGALEAALPMVLRQMSTLDVEELARGLRTFARQLEAIAALGDVDEGAQDAAAGIA